MAFVLMIAGVQKFKRALLHHVPLRLARACTEHASSAPFWGTDFHRFCASKTGDFSGNVKSSVLINIQLSIIKISIISFVVKQKTKKNFKNAKIRINK
jgi:hypothetical protein